MLQCFKDFEEKGGIVEVYEDSFHFVYEDSRSKLPIEYLEPESEELKGLVESCCGSIVSINDV